jgi:hypothetical protein
LFTIYDNATALKCTNFIGQSTSKPVHHHGTRSEAINASTSLN